MKKDNPQIDGYQTFLGDIKARIQAARISAGRAVNNEMILLYWDIGATIVEKQNKLGWGESVVEKLSKDLRAAFPGVAGYSARNLRDMKRFYLIYSAPEFWRQAVAKLPKDSKWRQAVAKLSEPEHFQKIIIKIPWGQHLHILNKTKAADARLYYISATAQFGWTRNVLLNQIKTGAYERAKLEKKTHNFPIVLPEYLAEQAEEALKSSYNLDFLGIKHEVKERELENRLVERLKNFILELGYGFCFIGQQHQLTLGHKEYFIDLLFYHRFLKTLVAFELKAGAFEPEYAGKMDFYLNLLNDKERASDDNPSIGIILCAEKDDVEVDFSLKTKNNPIGVAKYYLTGKLPKELKGKLPSEKEIRTAFLLAKETLHGKNG